jgi:hypothetical protein
MWLEDYRLACHAGGATDDLFIIENLSLFLGQSESTWREHLPRGKIDDLTECDNPPRKIPYYHQ